MGTSYRPYEPSQQRLLPEALQDWLPEGHLAYFISDTLDGLDLSAFHARYAEGGAGNQPFHPLMMVKVLLYAYATGVFSSRKIARKLHEDVAFRVLAAENYPAHRTISDFRALHLSELSGLFVQVLKLARELGLIKLGTVAIDGTKLKANASRHKAMSYERMLQAEAELNAQIKALLDKAECTDEAERHEPELDLPAEIKRREDRLQAIVEAKARLEARQREADAARGRREGDDRKARDKAGKPTKGRPYKREFGVPEASDQESFTDSDSRIMKRAGGGFDYSYNAQTAVDETAHLIVAAEVSQEAADSGELPGMLAAIKANVGESPAQALADAGYRNEAVFEQLNQSGVELIVALGREGKAQVQIDAARRPRTVAMQEKLTSEAGQTAYRKRKWIAEPPNGWIKAVLGFRQFSLRGLEKVRGEFKLVCLALNLRPMATMQTV